MNGWFSCEAFGSGAALVTSCPPRAPRQLLGSQSIRANLLDESIGTPVVHAEVRDGFVCCPHREAAAGDVEESRIAAFAVVYDCNGLLVLLCGSHVLKVLQFAPMPMGSMTWSMLNCAVDLWQDGPTRLMSFVSRRFASPPGMSRAKAAIRSHWIFFGPPMFRLRCQHYL